MQISQQQKNIEAEKSLHIFFGVRFEVPGFKGTHCKSFKVIFIEMILIKFCYQCTPIPLLSIPIPYLSIHSRFRSILLWNRFRDRNRRIGIGIGSTLFAIQKKDNSNKKKLFRKTAEFTAHASEAERE